MAKIAVENLLLTKSGAVYEAAFVKLYKWCTGQNVTEYSENVLFAYILEMAPKLWAHYSIVKFVLSRTVEIIFTLGGGIVLILVYCMKLAK